MALRAGTARCVSLDNGYHTSRFGQGLGMSRVPGSICPEIQALRLLGCLGMVVVHINNSHNAAPRTLAELGWNVCHGPAAKSRPARMISWI